MILSGCIGLSEARALRCCHIFTVMSINPQHILKAVQFILGSYWKSKLFTQANFGAMSYDWIVLNKNFEWRRVMKGPIIHGHDCNPTLVLHAVLLCVF